MEHRRMLYRGVVAALVVSGLATTALAGCGGASSGAAEVDHTLTVFAAASLTDAFRELTKTFEEQNPGTKVTMSFESSSTLLTQLRQGARADVFASAAEE